MMATRTKKRQQIRKLILIASFLLFPVTLYYFSPMVSLYSASEGVLSGSLLLFGLMFITSLVLGRLWCGWVCPAGGMAEITMLAQDRRVRGKRIDWIKWVIWVPWFSMLGFFLVKAGGFRVFDFTFQTANGISVVDVQGYVIYFAVVGLIFLLSLLAGRRAFCHTVCWMAPFMILGRKLANWLRLPGARLRAERSNCIECGRCTSVCPMSLEVKEMVLAERMENSECVLCVSCADVCPKDVISLKMSR
ncbi:MAG: 4Fe-4S binding protein [Anaerolineaceae bacterium]|nr:4Fe-4S binding protein [Anaerolineaceae bacterium]